MLPDWLLPSVADVRAECDVRPRELFSLSADENSDDTEAADEAKLVTLITGHINTQGAWTWGELSTESRSMPFPLTLSVLSTAYPSRSTDTQDDITAQGEANALTIENQKTSAQLIVKNLVIAKLHYGVSGEDAQTEGKNAYITAQTLLRSAKKQIIRHRAAWLSNTLDPFS